MTDASTLKCIDDILSLCQSDNSLILPAVDGINKIIEKIQLGQQNNDNESYKSFKIYEKIKNYVSESKKTFPKIKDLKLFIELIMKTHKTQKEFNKQPSTSLRKKDIYSILEQIYEEDNSIFEKIKQFINDPERNKA